MQDMKTTTERQRKSESLTDKELRKFKKIVDGFKVKLDCAEYFNVDRGSIERVYDKGSASPSTIQKIRQHIAA
jgi:hypothetical protein